MLHNRNVYIILHNTVEHFSILLYKYIQRTKDRKHRTQSIHYTPPSNGPSPQTHKRVSLFPITWKNLALPVCPVSRFFLIRHDISHWKPSVAIKFFTLNINSAPVASRKHAGPTDALTANIHRPHTRAFMQNIPRSVVKATAISLIGRRKNNRTKGGVLNTEEWFKLLYLWLTLTFTGVELVKMCEV